MTLPPPHVMTAIEISEPGGPEVLRPVEVTVPVPKHGEILIRVAYAGVNRPDALQRAGLYAPPPTASPLPGLEASGWVAAVGPGVTRWREGDEVTALLPGGGYAEYAITPEDHALPLPEGIGLREAACLPENAPSRGVLEKTGFKYEGVAQAYLQIAGRWRNHVLYANLRADRRGRTDAG